MDIATTRIPARSQRQAMDWSLVLASQEIECAIEQPGDGSGWGITVALADYEPALDAIRQYRIENRRWPWQQRVLKPGLLFDWGSLAWVLLLGIFFWLNANRFDLQTAGVMNSRAVAQGQWWRLFTAVWLHADAAHLAANATIGIVLLGLVMGLYGTGAGLLAAYVAGALGNAFAGALSTEIHRSLGASGMVMGALGLLTVQSLATRQRDPHTAKLILGGILAGLMLFVLLGLSATPGTDLLAHLGGFLGGLVLGSLLTLVPKLAQRPALNFVAGLLFALLVIVPWWLALVHSSSR
jgi:membrane associated rhomboid family serine protease